MMKKTIKKNFLLAFVLASAATLTAATLPMFAENVASAATETTFSMQGGAEIRKDGTGIRFTTVLSETYYNSVTSGAETVEVYTLVDKKGNTDEGEERKIVHTPQFENGVATLYGAIIYNELTETQIDLASAIELEANCYIAVGGETVATAKVTDNAREMRAVALVAKMKGSTADLSRYVGTLSKNSLGTVNAAQLATLQLDGANGNVYLNAKKLDVTATDGAVDISAYEQDLVDGETYYLSIFGDADDGASTNDASVYEFVYEAAKKIDMTGTKFSAFEGKIDYSFLNGETVVSAMQGETVLTVDQTAGTLKGVTPNITANGWYADSSTVYTGADVVSRNANAKTRKVNPTTVRFVTEQNNAYDVTLMAYTLVINDVSELQALSIWGASNNKYISLFTNRYEDVYSEATGNKNLYGYYLDGYFILGDDIDASTWTDKHWGLSGGYQYAFTGVFDGDGKTITMKSGANGLFGSTWRSHIKNFNLVINEQTATTGFCGIAQTVGGSQWKDATYLENVNVTINNFGTASENGNSSFALAQKIRSYAYLQNVNITLNWAIEPTAKTTGLLFKTGASITADTISTTKITDNGNSGLLLGSGTYYKNGTQYTADYWTASDGKTADNNNVVVAGITRVTVGD